MSFRAVELQIALPKTFDAGKREEQHLQNVLNNQSQAHDAATKQFERNKKTVLHTAQGKMIKRDDPSGQSQQQTKDGTKHLKEQQLKKETSLHPFKGNFVDFSG